MNKNNIVTIMLGVLLVCAVGYIVWQNKLSRTINSNTSPLVTTNAPTASRPAKDIKITTPLNAALSGDEVIAGVGRLVYFEGSFPVELRDSNSDMVWTGPATAQSDWMVTDYVPFSFTIPTKAIPNGSYTLVLTQDDPSGELVPPALYSISVPVTIAN